MAFFLGLTIGQLVYGPLSDRYGRKLPTYAGLTLFVVGSLACGLAPTPSALLAARFCQGLGGSIGMGDPDARVGFSYACNKMHTRADNGPRARRILEALYGII